MASQIRQFRQKLERAKRGIKRDAKRTTSLAGQRYKMAAISNIRDNDSIASGDLAGGIGYQRIAVGSGVNIAQVRLESSAGHSGYVEHGIGAKGDGIYPKSSRPPTGVIANWIIIKPGFNLRGPLWPVASQIADNIEQEGIAPARFHGPAVEDAWRLTQRRIRESLRTHLS